MLLGLCVLDYAFLWLLWVAGFFVWEMSSSVCWLLWDLFADFVGVVGRHVMEGVCVGCVVCDKGWKSRSVPHESI